MSAIVNMIITGHTRLLCPTASPNVPEILNRWISGRSKYRQSTAKFREVSPTGECDTYIWVCGIDGIDFHEFMREYGRVLEGLKVPPNTVFLLAKRPNDQKFHEVEFNPLMEYHYADASKDVLFNV